MSKEQPPPIDRINVEPAIIFGLSSSESLWVIMISVVSCAPFAAVAAIFGGMIWAVIVGFGGPVAAVYLAAQKMAAVKRDRPDMYYLHVFRAWLARAHLRKSRFICTDGDWDLGRSLPR